MLISALIYCVILCVKHIFPFGKTTIDYYDLSQQIAPLYYHIHDMLHSKTAFFYNFYSGLGINMSVVTSGCSGLSPFNLFFLLVPRDYLLESLSFFQLIKVMAMTFTMFFYLDKRFRAPRFFNIFLSVNYAFSGFVLTLYMENKWMDIAVFFPLLMYFYDRMVHGGRITGYVVTLALVIISSFYMGAIILVFIFLYTGVRILADMLYRTKPGKALSSENGKMEGEPEGKRRHFILELGFSTFLGILLSSFILIPQLTQLFASTRFENGSGSGSEGGILGFYLNILKQTEPAYTTRWWALFNLAFSAAVIFVGLLRVRGNRKLRFLTITLAVMTLAELFIESINLLWHFGSYIQYPIRNGFIINFVFAILACMYAERMFTTEVAQTEDSNGQGFEWVSLAGLLVTVILFAIFVSIYSRHPGMEVRSVFHIVLVMMLISFAGYAAVLFWQNGAHYSLSLMILCTELLCYGFIMYGGPTYVTGYSEEPEQERDYIRIATQLKKDFGLSSEYLYRVKNPDESLNANYSFILERPALSNWTHIIPGSLQKSSSEWGYSTQFTRLLDAGGTVFTDALIGVRDVISCLPQDEELYEKVSSTEVEVDGKSVEYTWYKCRYSLPFGVPVYANAMFDSELENRNPVSLQNQMYRSLTGADTEYEQEIADFLVRRGQLIDESAVLEITEPSSQVKRYTFSTEVKGKKALYFNSQTADMEDGNMSITVLDRDGSRAIAVPSIKDTDNTDYPAHFNNNILYLGSYENENVSVIVDVDRSKGEDYPVNISQLDLEKLRCLCDSYRDFPDEHISAGKKSISFNASVSEDAGSVVMLLPVAYDEGWTLRVNGKKSDIMYSYSGLFTAIPLYSGDNNYKMTFFPSGMGLGIVISFLGLAIFAAIIVIRHQKITVIENELVVLSRDGEKWLTPVYMIVWAIAVILMYIIPAGAFVIL